jgi:hypothetical protein
MSSPSAVFAGPQYRTHSQSQVFAQRHPRYLLRLYNSHDECFSLLMLAIEHHYLTTWGASPFIRERPLIFAGRRQLCGKLLQPKA